MRTIPMWVPALRGLSLLLVLCVSLAALSAVPTGQTLSLIHI